MAVTAWAVQCKGLDDLDLLARLKARLVSESESERVARYRNTSDAVRFALGRFLLRSLVAYTSPEQSSVHWNEVLLDEGANGSKPCLAPSAKPQSAHVADFNISHDGEWVLAAVTSGGIVGVDVARVYCPDRMTDVEYISEFSHQLSLEEKEYLCQKSEQRLVDFHTIWAAKEAYAKAIGVGIAIVDLSSISVHLPQTHEDGSLDITVSGQPCTLKIVTGSFEASSYIYALAISVSTELEFKKVLLQDILQV